MPKLDDIDQILDEAHKRGVDFQVTPDAKLRSAWTSGKRDDALAARIKANKWRIIGRLAPDLVTQRLKNASLLDKARYHMQHGNEVINSKVNSLIDKIPTEGSYTGLDPYLVEGLRSAMPESITGKAVGAASLPLAGVGPSFAEGAVPGLVGAAGRTAAGAGVGAGIGALSGEGAGQGVLQGGGAQLIGEGLGAGSEIPAGVKNLANRFKIISGDTEQSTGSYLTDLVGLPWIKKQIGKGRSLVTTFRDAHATDAAGDRYKGGMNAIGEDLFERAKQTAVDMKDAFVKKFGFDPTKNKQALMSKGFKVPPEAVSAWKDVMMQVKKAKTIAQRFKSTLEQLHVDRDAAFSNKGFGPLKPGPEAAKAAQRVEKAEGSLRDELDDPKLIERYDNVNKEYSQFAAIRDLMDIDETLTDMGDFDPGVLQRELRKRPRAYQRRLGDAFEPLQAHLLRNAPNDAAVDVSGIMRRGQSPINFHGYGGKVSAYVRGMVPTRENPIISKYVGKDLPPLIAHRSALRPSGAEASNELIEFLKRGLLTPTNQAEDTH